MQLQVENDAVGSMMILRSFSGSIKFHLIKGISLVIRMFLMFPFSWKTNE